MTCVLRRLRLNLARGVCGYLPAVYTQRTAVSDAWTLHRSIALGNHKTADSKSESDSNTDGEMANYPHEDAAELGREKSEETYKEWEKYWKSVQVDKHHDGILNITKGAGVDWRSQSTRSNAESESSLTDSVKSKSQDPGRRWYFALRHGERVDLTYGQWVPHCFDENDKYVRKDLNMPLTISERAGGKEAYTKDTPLTRVGRLQAYLVGEGLRLANISISHVYASNALRCVETAHEMISGLQADPSLKIKVEPGLFEYKFWHMTKGIDFMTPQELLNAGYNVDVNYKPYVNLDVNSPEQLDEYYDRSEKVMHSAVKDTATEGGNIMFVGHAATLDLMAISLKRLKEDQTSRAPYQISNNLLRVPYCALAAMRDQPWEIVSPPCPPSINSSSGRFDWKILLDL